MKKNLIFILLTTISIHSKAEYFKPIENIELKTFYSSSKSFIPLNEGISLNDGINFYSYENGNFKISKGLFLSYSLRQNLNSEYLKNQIHKFYLDYSFKKLSVTAGKTSKNIGPSENSLILSKNAPPFPLLDIQFSSINFIGTWKFEFLNGWLDEKRKSPDRSNPKIFILRADWTISKVTNLGINRFFQYGGSGRPNYKIWEFPKIISSSEDNISYGKYDVDSYFGYDITLNLTKYFKNFDYFKFYYQNLATDISAFWQKEDKGKFYFPFLVKLRLPSYQSGFEIKKENNIYNAEFTSVSHLFYVHHLYPVEGYSYNDFSLGNPYGRWLWEAYFSVKHLYKNEDFLKCKIGIIRQPSKSYKLYPSLKTTRYYGEFEYSFSKGNKIFSPYLRLEYSKNYDANPLPMQFDIKQANKLFIISGISTKIKF